MYDIFGSKSIYFVASITLKLRLGFSHLHCLEFFYLTSKRGISANMSDEEEGGSQRAKKDSQHKEIQVCRSWMHISHDPIVGAQQKKSKLWERIEDRFKASMFQNFGLPIDPVEKVNSSFLLISYTCIL